MTLGCMPSFELADCYSSSDCPGLGVCVEGVCSAAEVDGGTPDGHDAGVNPIPDGGLDAGLDASLADDGRPPPRDGGLPDAVVDGGMACEPEGPPIACTVARQHRLTLTDSRVERTAVAWDGFAYHILFPFDHERGAEPVIDLRYVRLAANGTLGTEETIGPVLDDVSTGDVQAWGGAGEVAVAFGQGPLDGMGDDNRLVLARMSRPDYRVTTSTLARSATDGFSDIFMDGVAGRLGISYTDDNCEIGFVEVTSTGARSLAVATGRSCEGARYLAAPSERLVWSADVMSGWAVFVAERVGQTFQPASPTPASAGTPDSDQPVVVAAGAAEYLGWTSHSNRAAEMSDVYLRELRGRGPHGDAQRITCAPGAETQLAMAFHSVRRAIGLTWVDARGAKPAVYFSEYLIDEGRLTPFMVIGDPADDEATQPAIAAGDGGYVITWSQSWRAFRSGAFAAQIACTPR